MRKCQREMLLDLLGICRKKHDAQKLMRTDDPEQETVMNSCIGYASQMIEFVSRLQGEDDDAVRLLRDYMDEMTQMRDSGNMRPRVLKQHVSKLQAHIQKHIPIDRLEVVFFPYKASMADSMMTIYLAAKADPYCDAYWCPIPYYERDSKGNYGSLRYEGALYSTEFEITDWESYNVEARCPDIAFIHNQYDEGNYVTTVHPRFYSHVLKKQASLVVLTEYGLMPWLPRDATKIPLPEPDKIGLFSAQWFADVLISFSLEHMQDVATPMVKAASCPQYVRDHIEDKVVALGSPKFDCVIRGSREKYPLPEEWARAINGRKVLLYNNAIAEMLSYEADHIADIKATIECVESRDDIVLWWRPHPLAQDTLRSLRPNLIGMYEEVVEAFRRSGKGIYDDTWDLHRAIAWTDGLLTNDSSLLWLYLASGKPFSLQSRGKLLPNPVHDTAADFHAPLQTRMENMRVAKGANRDPEKWNVCVWWDNFLLEDVLHNVHYDQFLERFIHYIVHPEAYPEAEEYRELQLKIYKDFVINPDGTAGEKIYQYCKDRVLGSGALGRHA